MKSLYNNNKFKISAPTWNDKFELSDGHILYQVFKIIFRIFQKNIMKRLIIHQ